jgi:hypothetical protein
MSYKVVEWLRIFEFGMPMSLLINTKAARILGVTLLSTAASTLAGCASTSFTDSRSAQDTGISKDMPDSKSDTRPSADEWHVLRDAFLDPARMSVNIFSLFGLPVVFIRDANCPQ